MKNGKAIGLLGLAVVIGLAASVYAAGWVSQKGSIASNKVVVAAMDIDLGSRINPQMLTAIDWPQGSVPSGAFGDTKDLQDRVVKTSIQRGEAILDAKLAPVGSAGGMSAVITNGKRAITVRVNDVVGVAGFALPGNYVDVMISTKVDDVTKKEGQQKEISKTVLEHVLVLAVAQEAGRDSTKPQVVNAVTLEVSLEDAEKLDLARNIGSLSLVLRNQMDNAPIKTAGSTKTALLALKEVATPAPEVKQEASSPPVAQRKVAATVPVRKDCVEVIHNNTRTLNCF
jgi:pilus assembly protein CpaB